MFRSANPAIWNTGFKKDNELAVPVDKAPTETRYLRLTVLGKKPAYVIMAMRKDQLRNEWEQGAIGWNGTGRSIWGGFKTWPGRY